MLEMVVADDLRPNGSAAPAPSKRMVPAPHNLVAPGMGPNANGIAALPPGSAAAGSLTGRRGALGGSNGGSMLPAAAVQQLLAQQATSKAVTAQLGLAQRQVEDQALELTEVRRELSKKEAEVVSLRHQLAERDGKLKAARTDALEARMALQQKDAELKAAFAQLSEAVHERSVMRTQLAQTHAELAETRAELEQLADDILAIKLLMDDEDFAGEEGAEAYAYDAGGAPAGAELAGADEALDILQSLAALSRQLVEDASEDDAILESMAGGWAGQADAGGAAV
ncbi:hypothetical protein CHLNCDRAFT_136394 [Chlorella variabilis]|uniref:Uncharacterized protein n=1 Tax=Chlorella variabilis TaxID=554065 RepID=E1ZK97_CHLVA|nr:hypothetical protein CHLNCDRAFT_136394 [Chlorella variabilis]EFN53767.1 hypothetical protein CHLNCDRAFT_136394 [Chlorella variabilis]|eukprot:XP_005845869.1 hypothetical protein CHLNCDRAFT_136394 [Chlorella variabilis]